VRRVKGGNNGVGLKGNKGEGLKVVIWGRVKGGNNVVGLKGYKGEGLKVMK
jgi:hypothetical protein